MKRRNFLKAVAAGTVSTSVLWENLTEAAIEKGRLLSVIDDGLPKVKKPASVIVVGAGMAGLVAAYELKKAGHQVTRQRSWGTWFFSPRC